MSFIEVVGLIILSWVCLGLPMVFFLMKLFGESEKDLKKTHALVEKIIRYQSNEG